MSEYRDSCLARKTKRTDLVTVKDLFCNTKLGENCFRIPDYQRGYAWRTEFEVLWKDILRILKSNNNEQSHYTGMLALEEMSQKAKLIENLSSERNAFYVADGQQRLTSIVIILQSLFEYIKEESNGEEDLSGEYLIFGNNEYRFDYSVERRDAAKRFFENRILRNSTNESSTDIYSNNIDCARKFIDEALKMFDVETTKQILNIVLNKLLFNIYFIADFDVRVTFETMNNRGKQLTKLELLKNRLMYLSSFFTDPVSETKLKETINNAWKDIYENLGLSENTSESDDEYLRAHWFVYHGYNKGENEKYIKEILDDAFAIDEGKFHKYISESSFNEAFNYIEKYAKSLGEFSKYWVAVNHPEMATNINLSDEEKKWLDKLRRIPLNRIYVRPAIMAVCAEQTNSISQTEKVVFYKTLERTIFLYKVLGYNEDDNFSPVLKNASELFKAESRQDKHNAYLKLVEESKAYKTEQDYKEVVGRGLTKLGEKLNNNKSKFYYGWNGLSYFLYEYDLELGDGKRIVWDLIKKGDSIEHILPQDIEHRDYWKIVIGDMEEEQRVRLTNSIGNLLLLSTSNNSYLSNHSFPVKKGLNAEHKYGYRFGTRSEIEVANKDFWTPHEIYLRQEKLFKKMYERWIKDDFNIISENDFYKMLELNNLLISDAPDISDENKQLLNSVDYSKEAETIKKEIDPNVSNLEKEEFKAYFNIDEYQIRPNPQRVSFAERCFSFVIKEDGITCGTLVGGRDYKIYYSYKNKNIKIESFNVDWSNYLIESNEEALPDTVNYYLRTLRRYLRRKGYGDAPLYIYQPTPEERIRNNLSKQIINYLRQQVETKNIEMLTEDNDYIRFASLKIRDKVGLFGKHTKSWSNIYDLAVFEIRNDIKCGPYLILYLGPSLSVDVRRKWYNFTRHTSVSNKLFKKKRSMSLNWDAMTKTVTLAKESSSYPSEEEYCSIAMKNLEEFMDTTLALIEKEFENAPTDDNDPIYLD